MHRSSLLNLLSSYQPLLGEEKQFKHKMLMFIEANPECFERSLEEGHMTASSWLLNKSGTHALLIHHQKLDKWVQPGGHADGHTNLLEVAVKEAQEESGIQGITPLEEIIFDLDIHKIPANSKEKVHFHYDVRFLLQVKSEEVLHLNPEVKALRWFPKDATQQLPTTERSVIRMFEKWVARETVK